MTYRHSLVTLRGHLRSADGGEFSSLTVHAIDTRWPSRQYRADTDPDGRFSLVAPQGCYDVYVNDVDHAFTQFSGVVFDGDHDWNVELHSAGINTSATSGRLLGPEGNPAANYQLECLDAKGEQIIAYTQSGGDGAFALPDCHSGYHVLRVTGPTADCYLLPLPKPDKATDALIRLGAPRAKESLFVCKSTRCDARLLGEGQRFRVHREDRSVYRFDDGAIKVGTGPMMITSQAGPTTINIRCEADPRIRNRYIVIIDSRLTDAGPPAPYPAEYELTDGAGQRLTASVDFPFAHAIPFESKAPTIGTVRVQSLWAYTRGLWADAPVTE